jgi:uncharacterized phage infection (PIP) family protein YhgE
MIADFEAEARAAHDPVADLYRFALREGGRHLYLYDPTSPASTGALNGPLEEMQAVEADPVRFQTPYSEILQANLTAAMIRVAGEANEVYTEIAHLNAQFGELNAERAQNNQNLPQINQQIAHLAERVRINEEELAQVPEGLFAERIAQINAELETVQQNKIALNHRLSQIDTEAYITYHSGGNGWRVADGEVTLEENKVFDVAPDVPQVPVGHPIPQCCLM